MARAFWKGSVSFGLVDIPVSLRPALESKDLSFTLLNKKDFQPVGYKRYDKNTGQDVPWEQIVKGYEYEPDEYVVLSDDELKRANTKATQTIEIIEFVDQEEIDPLLFDTPYHVEPLKKGSKSYALLRDAMKKTGKVGIAKVVLRTRQHVAALMVRDKALVLLLLRYAHELRSVEDVDAPGEKAVTSQKELEMAEQLIEGMAAKWKPTQFHDEYRDDVLRLVDQKVKAHQTHTIVEPAAGEEPAPKKEVVDLMPLLKKSLEQSRAPAPEPPAESAPRGRAGKNGAKRGHHPAHRTHRRSA
jgi:DNA end-binding protein Ku